MFWPSGERCERLSRPERIVYRGNLKKAYPSGVVQKRHDFRENQSGRTLVTVRAEGLNAEAWTIMQRHGAYRREAIEVNSMAQKAKVVSPR